MSMNISGLGNTYNGINTNSKQYKALKEKGWLSGIMQNEAILAQKSKYCCALVSFCGTSLMMRKEMKGVL